MGRRLAPAQIVIVNGRKIVMNQGMGMDHLNSRHKRLTHLSLTAKQKIRFLQKQRTQPFAACSHAVIHSFRQTGGKTGFLWQIAFQYFFRLGCLYSQFILKIHCILHFH